MDNNPDQSKIPVKKKVEFLAKVYDRMAGLTANADIIPILTRYLLDRL